MEWDWGLFEPREMEYKMLYINSFEVFPGYWVHSFHQIHKWDL